ncbi:muscarinic acetylcholine receptor M2-like [Diadema antillarum]|uniref:muscarinic acetylcholine receptor M2-like n=1 Tax=Diadema antillarum TaxID=105358 RepID=UPI003A84B0FC
MCMPIRGSIFAFDRTWILGQTFCHIFIGIQHVLPGVSVFGTVVICFDRYLATAYPLLHYRKKSKKVAKVVNVLTWLTPLSLWMGLSTIWDLVSPNMRVSPSGFCHPNYAENVASMLIIVVLRAGIPFAVILVLSAQIFSRAKSAHRNRMVDHVSLPTTAGQSGENILKGNQRSSLSKDTEYKLSSELETHQGKKIPFTHGQDDIVRRQRQKIGLDDIEVCGIAEQGGRSEEKSHFKTHTGSSSHGVYTLSRSVQTDRRNMLSFSDVDNNNSLQVSENVAERNSAMAPELQPDPPSDMAGIARPALSQRKKRASDGSKALRTLAFLVVALYLTWLPNTLIIIFRSAAPAWFTQLPFEVQLRESGRWISYCNSTLNPLAYTLAQPLLRHTIQKMFCKK